jgi:hypothetical protein
MMTSPPPATSQKDALERMVAHLKHIYPERCSWIEMIRVGGVKDIVMADKRALRNALAARDDTHFRSGLGGNDHEIGWHDTTSGMPKIYNRSDLRNYISQRGERGVALSLLNYAYPGVSQHIADLINEDAIMHDDGNGGIREERIFTKSKFHGIKRTHTQANSAYETL